MKIYTIGFTRKRAETFFGLLRSSGARRVIDTRLNNVSQLAGFAKRDDLRFFLRELCEADYLHVPDFAPSKDILNGYRKGVISWLEYEQRFLDLMARRAVERLIDPVVMQDACLLCSEHQPHFCHRRLVAEYLNSQWGSTFKVEHLV